jgi:tetratricopeptide (TPR) repeat protein
VAEADFTAAITRGQDDAAVYFRRGVVRAQQGKYAEAEADFTAAITRGQDGAEVYSWRGKMYVLLGNVAAAFGDYDHAVALEPHNDWTFYHRAILSQALGRDVQAQADLDTAMALSRPLYEDNARDWPNTFNLALYSLAADQGAEAARLQGEALAAGPPPAVLAEAMQDLEDFLRLFPQHARALAQRQALAQYISATDPASRG